MGRQSSNIYGQSPSSSIAGQPTYSVVVASSFAEYVSCSEANVMVKRICGCLDSPQSNACGDYSPEAQVDNLFRTTVMTRRHLECAKRRLERFSVVLLTEMIATSSKVRQLLSMAHLPCLRLEV